MTRSLPSSGLALACAALLWLGWMLACANKNGAQPSAQVQAPEQGQVTGAQPATTPAAPGATAIEPTAQQLTAFGQGTIDLATFNAVADANLGASHKGTFYKTLAANCSVHAAGQPRVDCIAAGLQSGQTPSNAGAGWDAHAQPKP